MRDQAEIAQLSTQKTIVEKTHVAECSIIRYLLHLGIARLFR